MIAAFRAPLFRRLLRFAVIGGVGFVVDAGLLTLFAFVGVDPFLGRLVSLPSAILTTWRLNRTITFGASQTSQVTEAARYSGVALVIAGVNYAIYAAVLTGFPTIEPVLAVLCATAISATLSYIGYAKLVFRTET